MSKLLLADRSVLVNLSSGETNQLVITGDWRSIYMQKKWNGDFISCMHECAKYRMHACMHAGSIKFKCMLVSQACNTIIYINLQYIGAVNL